MFTRTLAQFKLFHYRHAEPRHPDHHYRQDVCSFVPVRLPAIPALELRDKVAHHHAGEKAICEILDVALGRHHPARQSYRHLRVMHRCLDKRLQLTPVATCQSHAYGTHLSGNNASFFKWLYCRSFEWQITPAL